MNDTKFHARAKARRNIFAALRAALRRLREAVSSERYRPEEHYMRGPGPKTRAKQQPVDGAGA